MGSTELVLRVLWALLMLVPLACSQSSNCPLLLDSQLGDTSNTSTEGLLAEALREESGGDDVSLQILETQTVCLSQGTVKDTYHSVSVVVRYRESGGMEEEVQVEYQCTDGEWGFGNQSSVTLEPVGNLSTALRTDCSLCIKPNISAESTAEEHCVCKKLH